MVETKQNNKKVCKFTAEVSRILHIVIHSLYKNKEIFLRELLSNAADALDKLSYQGRSNQVLFAEDSELKIQLQTFTDKSQLIVRDNGIGMNEHDLETNLGTIAHSGTQKFLEALQNQQDIELIGQFGVGFYAAFMVADKIVVQSRKAGEEESWQWTSDGKGEFTIERLQTQLKRGTSIILHLHDKEFLDKFRIENIVNTYAEHIPYVIEYINEKDEVEKLNSGIAIWTKGKDEITPEQHQEFFRNVAHVGGMPWMTIHNKNEGIIEYTNLLYIPSIKPFDLFHPDRRCSVKLYIKKVFITEDNVQIIPSYLRFLKGIVDSADLPLNISRESLQQNNVINKIKTSLTKRVIDELRKKFSTDRSDYEQNFWTNFGAVLKEGLCEAMPTEERERLLDICVFHNLQNNDLISMAEYVKDMLKEQEYIYYLTGNNVDAIRCSPQLEGFMEKGVNVLLLTDSVDEFWMNVVTEYKNIKLKSVTRSDIDLVKFPKKDEQEALENNTDEDEINAFLKYIKEILGNSVSAVKLSTKLVSSPACLSVPEGSMDIRMEKFMVEQKQMQKKSAKTLEINVHHAIVKSLLKMYANNTDIKDFIKLLFDQACIIEGEEIADTMLFVKRINYLMSKTIASE